jgi:hypothetical protein
MPEPAILELFPLTRVELFKLPDLAVDSVSQADTYKSLFFNELLALETCAKRNLAPAHYFRHPDGSTNLDLSSIVLDASSFYLFAHKTLVSGIFIFAQTLPTEHKRGIQFRSFTTFAERVRQHENDVYTDIYTTCGYDVAWVQKSIIEKRDDLVQHWQGNDSNKFFTSVYAWDLPLLVYYDPKRKDDLDKTAIDSLCTSVRRNKPSWQLDPSADALQKIVWLEGWSPKLSRQIQADIASLTDNSAFISLPITPQLIERLDKTLAGLLGVANRLKVSNA